MESLEVSPGGGCGTRPADGSATAADRDHVVVGATPEHACANVLRPSVRDFPVFLHPESTRITRLRGPSVRADVATWLHLPGRSVVTLEEELARRDPRSKPSASAGRQPGRPLRGARGFRVCCGTCRRLSPRTRSACCASRVSRRLCAARVTIARRALELMRQMVGAGEVDIGRRTRLDRIERALLNSRRKAFVATCVLWRAGAMCRKSTRCTAYRNEGIPSRDRHRRAPGAGAGQARNSRTATRSSGTAR